MGKSPLPPLQQHLRLAVDCCEKIALLLEAAARVDHGELKALRFKLIDLVQQAQVIHAELGRDWPKGVLVPIRRRDVVLVLESQQEIFDAGQQIASVLQLPLNIPPQVNRLMLSLAECGAKTCGRALRVIESLDSVIRSGVKGPDVSRFYQLVDEVGKSHDDARSIADDLRTTLHEQCKDSAAVSLVFILELARLLGELSRHADLAVGRALLLVSR
jgi:predicted phosphate transport protein (TIGR00153 family)